MTASCIGTLLFPITHIFFCDLSVDVCVENESSSAISATTNQQSSTGLHIQLKDETKSAEAAKLPVEFVAKVFV